ncbi:M15 family metallopeptidase [Spirillospora sp. CA-294931]|uniref:M15 family metallopeptidase n=1 Tax=Spirillospora sp. CA-294931 TaxID=3240042 RepID=UPI003D8FCD59
MHQIQSSQKAPRKTSLIIGIALIIVVATVGVAVFYQSQNSSPSSSVSSDSSVAPPPLQREKRAASGKTTSPKRRTAVGQADGVVPAGVTVFADSMPAVSNLDPDLLKALRRAATDAADDGITFYVNSGWRSPAYQNQLLRKAVSKYGSKEAAARWVSTAGTSLHVKGKAVDIGQFNATTWLSEHGATYGLCQIYRNEPWHYELRTSAAERGCPRMYADPTQDPRMQQ